jgi:uncharacterized membrane protein
MHEKSLPVLLAAALAATAAAPVWSQAAPRYRIVDLGPNITATGVNAHGVVSARYIVDSEFRAARISGKALHPVDDPGSASLANGISPGGDLVGHISTPFGGYAPAAWPKDGPMQRLDVPVPGGYASVLAAARDHVYAGYAATPNSSNSQCAWWKDGVATALPNSLGGNECAFLAVDSRGRTFAGRANTSVFGHDHAVFYADGAMHDLGAPDFGTASATGANVAGHVVGVWGFSPGSAFFYDGTAMSFLEAPAGSDSAAAAVNDRDEVAGYVRDPLAGTQDGALWLGGRLFKFADLVDDYADWGFFTPASINDDGVIVGVAQRARDGAWHGFALVKAADR